MRNKKQLEKWFKEFEVREFDEGENFDFENLESENKFHPIQQVSAILFLASKLKNKSKKYFLEGQHDTIFIGSSFEDFEDFTEDDVRIATFHDIFISEDGDGFQIWASM